MTQAVQRIIRQEVIDEVIASFPVNMALLHNDQALFVAYYNPQHQLCVASRPLTGGAWSKQCLPVHIEWDSHNYITMAFDADGYIHLSANMHVDPLVYFTSKKPYAIEEWEQQQQLVGENEDRCTYPAFLNTSDGTLIFHYRDGSSGDGGEIYNMYNHHSKTWQRLLAEALCDGLHEMNAYMHGPVVGPDNWYYLCWVWRDDPAADSNHDLSFMKSPDLLNWFSVDGNQLSLPVTPAARACIVDPVPCQAGMINGNNKIGFDDAGNAFLVYHKFDEHGITQVYCAQYQNNTWSLTQISQWDYRWEFGGWGSLEFEIRIQDPVHHADQIIIAYTHAQYGAGYFSLDPQSLAVIQDHRARTLYPAELYTPTSAIAGMRINQVGSFPAPYILLWESMPNNRDKKPAQADLCSQLRLIELA